jgi:hypothetical protein
MQKALVQHAENDVDHEDGDEEQHYQFRVEWSEPKNWVVVRGCVGDEIL